MKTVTYEGMTFDEYISAGEIAQIVQDVAQRIAADYRDKQPVLICVLHGAMFFLTDLMRALPIDCSVATVHLQSYDGTSSTGQVRENVPLQTDIRDKDVIVVEDIVDSGITMHYFKQILRSRQPRTVKVVSLLSKPSELQYEDAKPDYVGREIPKKFVIGYGFDIHDLARNLPSIYALRDNG
ncbi:MAG: hypoxanthine phosphoribosyltransferase [Paludibacteraceae bacterium]|nr:hypoxanthine phosphoribosyltransferase [Paludibacteraceae bacterium]